VSDYRQPSGKSRDLSVISPFVVATEINVNLTAAAWVRLPNYSGTDRPRSDRSDTRRLLKFLDRSSF
jgi:hypothetical protein